MEQKTEQNKTEKIKKIPLSKENPAFYKILVVVGIITAVLNTLLMGSGDFIDFIFGAAGFIIPIIIISWIIGILPVLILRNKIKNARIKIYGIIFLLLCILTVLGNLEGYNEQNIKFTPTNKSDNYSEQNGNLYRNTKYNFRIKFPEGWEQQVGDGHNVLVKAMKGNHSINIVIKELPKISMNENFSIDEILTLDEFKEITISGLKEKFSNSKIVSAGETKIDNENAFWAKYTMSYSVLDATVDGVAIQYQILHNNIFYTITIGSVDNEFNSVEKILKESVSTFVFENYK